MESIDRKRSDTNEDQNSLPQINLKEKKGRNISKETHKDSRPREEYEEAAPQIDKV